MDEKEQTVAAAEARPAASQAEPAVKQAKKQAKKAKADGPQVPTRAPAGKVLTKARNIGIDVPLPEQGCDDGNCPFHGTLRVRGSILEGTVVSEKMNRTVVVRREYMHVVPKYERLEKRTSKHRAHCPPCLGVKAGDGVTIMECRPISKTVSFVVVQKRNGV